MKNEVQLNRYGPGEGELFAVHLKIYTTGLAGRSSANPETNESYFLSRGRGLNKGEGEHKH
jgi:hypothetical protein